MELNICIIGCGWYGCFIAEYIIENYSNINITMIDKENNIFSGSSYKNQNRLHYGYHYPRCKITRDKCKKYFNLFLNKYSFLVDDVKNNFYCVAYDSDLNFKKFISKFSSYNLEENNFLKNIDGKIINTNEKFINFEKSQKYFKEKLNKKVNFIFNKKIINIKMLEKNSKVILNENKNLIFDIVFNCTYNQIKSGENYFYEKCLTLLYKKINDVPFDCLTIMDGNYGSLFKYKDNIYSLTSVEYTPLIKNKNFEKIKDFKNYNLNKKKKLFENMIQNYYPDFKKNFVYFDFYESFKCKNLSSKDSRDINININKNIFNVWCGKISLIFELENEIKNFLYKFYK